MKLPSSKGVKVLTKNFACYAKEDRGALELVQESKCGKKLFESLIEMGER